MTRYQKHSEDLRRRAIDEVLVRGRKLAEVGREMGIVPQTLGSWVRQARVDLGLVEGTTSGDRSELARLRKEVTDQRRTIEILKAASAFFAQEADRQRR